MLKQLESPVEIRFYVLLDPATLPDSVTAFAGRVDRLLSAYQQGANGKIKVSRHAMQSDADARAALDWLRAEPKLKDREKHEGDLRQYLEFLLSLRSAEILRRPKSLAYLQSLKWVAQVKEKVR